MPLIPINEEAKNGWRLKQIVVPPADNAGAYFPYCYQIIFLGKNLLIIHLFLNQYKI